MKATSEFLKASAIIRPTLILDKAQVTRNIARMAQKADAAGVRLRPHFKTHQSAGIGNLFSAWGVDTITVSSLEMAEYFANHGWNDITVAIPLNLLAFEQVNKLAATVRLQVLVDSLAAINALAAGLKQNVKVWLEIDTGYERTGVWYEDLETALTLAEAIRNTPRCTFAGLLTHNGQTYTARTKTQVSKLHEEGLRAMGAVQANLQRNGIIPCEISIGDTPACSLLTDFAGIAEIRPGNFVFYDLMQAQIGACATEEIAVAVACPVIGKYPRRKQVAIHGGAVHFSKEALAEPDRTVYGYPTTLVNGSFGPAITNAPLNSISQEHGLLTIGDDALFAEINIGDVLLIFPVHSCLTTNLFPTYTALEGEQISIGNRN